MRVLNLIDTLGVGGAEKLLVTYLAQAREAGVDVEILSLRERRETPAVLALEALGAKLSFFSQTGLFNPGRFVRLVRFVRTGGFDLLHTHLTYANLLGILCAVWLRLPVVVSMHNVLSVRQEKRARERLEHFLLRFATRIVAVGENVGADYAPLYPGKVVTLSNAINEIEPLPDDLRAVLRRELVGADAEAPLLIAVGRLTAQKGFSDLIEAFALVHRQFPQAHLILAGDGKLRASLEADTAAHGLSGHIHWLGVREDIAALLSASDLYVSSAHWEGLSIAMLEAMSSGLAVVATEVGDAARLVASDAGLLVAPKSPSALAQAICDLLADPVRRKAMGAAGQARIRSEYDSRTWFGRLHEVYLSAIAEIRR
jgi:glycosyltransferase involved in cell wall biosynthesis